MRSYSNSPPTKQPKIGYRSSYDDMVEFLSSGHRMSATRMDSKSAPGWRAALEELSVKLGVEPPALYRVPTHRINAGMALDALVMTDGFLKASGSSPSDFRPSSGVLGVMAHELGHHKQSIIPRLGAKLLPWAAPMAAMAALYIYEQATQANKPLSQQELQEAIHKATETTVENMKKNHEHGTFESEHARETTTAWKESILYQGRYLLAAALGFGAGLLGARAVTRHLEFDADRIAVMLTGDAEGYIKCLENLHAVAKKQMTAELANKPKLEKVGEKIQDYLVSSWKNLMKETVHSHPAMKERAQALRNTFGEQVVASRTTTPPTLSI